MTLPIEYQNLIARCALEVVLSSEELRVLIRAHARRSGAARLTTRRFRLFRNRSKISKIWEN